VLVDGDALVASGSAMPPSGLHRGTPTTPQELVRWVPAGSEMPQISEVEVRAFSGGAWDDVKVCRKVTRGPFVMPRGHVASDLVAVVLASPERESGRFGAERVADRGPPGTVNVLPAGMPYTYECRGTREVLHVSLGGAADAGEEEAAQRVELHPVFGAADPLVVHIATALLHDCTTGSAGGRLYGEALGTALAAHLARHYAASREADPRPPGLIPARQLRRVLDYVEAHLARDLGLAELARVAAMSRSRFVEEFRRATGSSPHRYVTLRRVDRARALLASRELALHEIAALCGYQDQTSFARAFRKIVQMTPGAYRRALS
jgi:AraC family transcriptional regulator